MAQFGWRLVGVEPAPVFEQLGLMECSPLDGEGQGARRECTGQEADGLNSDLCLRA